MRNTIIAMAVAVFVVGKSFADDSSNPPVKTFPGVRLRNTFSPKGFHNIESPGFKAVTFLPSSDRFAAASRAGNVFVWGVDSTKPVREIRHRFRIDISEERNRFADARFGPEGKYVCLAGLYGNTTLWEIETGKLVGSTEHDLVVCAMAFQAKGRCVALAGFRYTEDYEEEGLIVLWDVADKRKRIILPKKTYRVDAIDFQAGGDLLAASHCLIVKDPTDLPRRQHCLWNTATGNEKSKPETPKKPVTKLPYTAFGSSLRFDPQGHYLIGDGERTGSFQSRTGCTFFYNMNDRKVGYVRPGWFGNLIAFTPDGRYIAHSDDFYKIVVTEHLDSRGRLVKNPRRKPLVEFPKSRHPVYELPQVIAFSPKNDKMVVGTVQGKIYLFDIDLEKLEEE